jgi:hypothetical protein
MGKSMLFILCYEITVLLTIAQKMHHSTFLVFNTTHHGKLYSTVVFLPWLERDNA